MLTGDPKAHTLCIIPARTQGPHHLSHLTCHRASSREQEGGPSNQPTRVSPRSPARSAVSRALHSGEWECGGGPEAWELSLSSLTWVKARAHWALWNTKGCTRARHSDSISLSKQPTLALHARHERRQRQVRAPSIPHAFLHGLPALTWSWGSAACRLREGCRSPC